jgi:starch synthase (maltosyl-transferring)
MCGRHDVRRVAAVTVNGVKPSVFVGPLPATQPQGPRIYELDPRWSGPDRLEDWLDHAVELGFDHLLLSNPFPTLPHNEARLVTDLDTLRPELGGGESLSALAKIAAAAHERGLALLIDVVVDRVAAHSIIGMTAAGIFAPQREDVVLDPRLPIDMPEIASAREVSTTDQTALGAWWAGKIGDWHRAGVAGVRLLGLSRLPVANVAPMLGEIRAGCTGCKLLAWTPGLAWDRLVDLVGQGVDHVFPSLPWWDGRSEWLWQEMALLRGIAPLVGCASSSEVTRDREPLAPNLARRAITVAAALASGWMLPAGLEFGLARPGEPGCVAGARNAGACDLSELVAALNSLRQRESAINVDLPPLPLIADGGKSLALLRPDSPDPRRADKTILLLMNGDHSQSSRVPTANILAAAGGAFERFEAVFPPADGPPDTLLAGSAPVLPAGEARLYVGEVTARPTPSIPLQMRTAELAARAPRIAIENVTPRVEGGNFALRRIAGESVNIEADIICDGHDQLAVALAWRGPGEAEWRESLMRPLSNDRWRGSIPLPRIGCYHFVIRAWRDVFATYRDELAKKHAAGVAITSELAEGKLLVQQALARAKSEVREALAEVVCAFNGLDEVGKCDIMLSGRVAALMEAADDRPFVATLDPPRLIEVDRTVGRFASWYEIFPRSMSDDPKRHGTFDDVIRHLPRVRAMGFDVLYFPPIHPIGRVNRKGRNNSLRAGPDDPGSPYAIGSEEGGHDAIHPELGTFEDFRRLLAACSDHGLEVALDFALQCAPDHPWLRQHKEWFAWRPDGSLRYAENPPKKYEDIVNFDFYAPKAVPDLWIVLCNIVLFWIKQGVLIFRVDNPHTKPLPFWHWLISEVRSRHPDAVFLAEAFTRPKLMYRLAKIGFTQSYTYFTWRNTKKELTEYLNELNTEEPREFFRPHFFVNTPDINPVPLQTSGRAGFLIRAALAATLSGLWGVYNGFELCEATPLPGREEYLDSEKYQIRAWDWRRPGNITDEIAVLNRIRARNPALQSHLGLTFLEAPNDQILVYEKATPERSNVLIVAVSLDPQSPQDTGFMLPTNKWGMADDIVLRAEDLLHGHGAVWHGPRQYVRLTPDAPYAIWRVASAN